MNYGTRSELELGFDFLVKKADPFGVGMTAEEMFPEFAEEARRVGIDNKEYAKRTVSMGFLPCMDGFSPDQLSTENVLWYESPSERHRRLHAQDVQP